MAAGWASDAHHPCMRRRCGPVDRGSRRSGAERDSHYRPFFGRAVPARLHCRGVVALLAERLDALAATESPLSRRLLRRVAFHSSHRHRHVARTCSCGARGRSECDHVDLRRTGVCLHRRDGVHVIRPHRADDRPASLDDPSYDRFVLHLDHLREQLLCARRDEPRVHSDRRDHRGRPRPAHRSSHRPRVGRRKPPRQTDGQRQVEVPGGLGRLPTASAQG